MDKRRATTSELEDQGRLRRCTTMAQATEWGVKLRQETPRVFQQAARVLEVLPPQPLTGFRRLEISRESFNPLSAGSSSSLCWRAPSNPVVA